MRFINFLMFAVTLLILGMIMLYVVHGDFRKGFFRQYWEWFIKFLKGF